MVIVWSNSAMNDLKNFKEFAQKSDPVKYILSLIDYVDNLMNNPKLGKIYSYVNETIIRQLIYQEHKVYYFIDDKQIHILSIVHYRENTKNRINSIKKLLKE